jgi:DNA-binding transcriptional ArsR family regulator
MWLDFAGIKAVSSQTRVRTLKETHRQAQPTVTSLGEELGLSKYTVSAHLDKPHIYYLGCVQGWKTNICLPLHICLALSYIEFAAANTHYIFKHS